MRLLTRAVTYSVVFGIGYGVGLGLSFGLASGIATGLTLSIELNRAARGLDHYSLPWEGLFSTIRGFAFGAGLYRTLGFEFATAFAILITVGQVFAYSRGMRPAIEYAASRRPRLTRRQLWGTVVRLSATLPPLSLQRLYPSRGPGLVFCAARRACDRNRHRRRGGPQSLHRILR